MNLPRYSLAEQNVLVTGASGSIGAAIVERLAAAGVHPIIHYGRDRAAAEALLARIAGNGSIVQADLASPDGAFELWRKTEERVGRIHGLVNNAGIRTEVTIDAELDVWQRAWRNEFQVNFFTAVDLCKEALCHFRTHQGGRIVNIASRAGQRGYSADAMAYGATKAALINLTQSIARSFGGDGVIAVSIAPGWVRSEMAEMFVATYGEESAVADIPIGVMAEPREIGEMVVFLLSPSQLSLNGATLDVNGGSNIR